MGLNWKNWYAWYPVKLTKGRGVGCWAWRREVEWVDWTLAQYGLRDCYGVERVIIREYRLPALVPDPLRTYDAWAKDENGKPQTWEQHMARHRHPPKKPHPADAWMFRS
jgi:hypothetical protein